MKRIFTLLLILCLLPLCWACSKDKPVTAPGPQIRYEGPTAYYTHEGSTYIMDLHFEQPLTRGSTVSLLLEEDEVLSFTAEAAFSRLQISSPKLEKNKDYTLKVNGKIQKHGSSNIRDDVPRPGDIPAPTQPTIPVAPMGEIETIPSTEATEAINGSLSLENPPTIAVTGEIPALTPVETTNNGVLPFEGFTPGHGEDNNDLTIRPAPQNSGTTFTLTATVTEFTSVGDAS